MHNLQVAIGAFFSSGKDGDGSFPVFLSWAANFYIVTPECRTGAFKDEFERIKKALEMK
jgi:hypothetical protein